MRSTLAGPTALFRGGYLGHHDRGAAQASPNALNRIRGSAMTLSAVDIAFIEKIPLPR